MSFRIVLIRFLFFICLSANGIWSSEITAQNKSFYVRPCIDLVVIDGKINETAWNGVDQARDFWQYFPVDSLLAEDQTSIQMCYDDTHLYIASTCYSESDDYIIPSFRRDFRAGGNDNVTFMFDTYADGNVCFFFGTNPLGVKREGTIVNGGQVFQDFSTSWDNKWECESLIGEGYWSSEMKIPLNILRFKESKRWRFNSYRFNIDRNETTTWSRIPQNQVIFSLAFMGDMIWEEPPNSGGQSISMIPFISSRISKNYEEKRDPKSSYSMGADVKIPMGSGLNLDLTFNPDFSQVEVDRQVTNLDRFEIFFPERRQFFIENADLFSNFGTRTINPFFSRRIGVATDTSESRTIQNRIYAGARLSGKINKDWRIGLMSLQTEEDKKNALPSFNYSVLAIQRKIWSRSNLGFIWVNKQGVGDKHDNYYDPYNRVIGVDFNFTNADNRWSGKTFLHYSDAFEKISQAFTHGLAVRYNRRRIRVNWDHEFVGEGYDAQVGFVRRRNYIRLQPQIDLRTYPNGTWFQVFGFTLTPNYFIQPGFGKTDHNIELRFGGQSRNFQRLNVGVNHQFVHLFNDFDPTGSDKQPLLGGTSYDFFYFTASYNTDRSRMISAQFQPTLGQYFNGMRYGMTGNVRLRYQPYGNISFNYGFNYFNMDHLKEGVLTLLFGPRIDLTFSKELFLTTFVQYNSQQENTNINARMQWRFAPVSDFFLVYTDNYFSSTLEAEDRFLFSIRNRALVAKLTYWFNT